MADVGPKMKVAHDWLNKVFDFDKEHPFTGGDQAEPAPPADRMNSIVRGMGVRIKPKPRPPR